MASSCNGPHQYYGTKYSWTVNRVKAEMDKFLPSINKKTRRKFKHCKPFWDMDLAEQWKKMHTAFIKFSKNDKRNISLRTRLKSVYIDCTRVNLIRC